MESISFSTKFKIAEYAAILGCETDRTGRGPFLAIQVDNFRLSMLIVHVCRILQVIVRVVLTYDP